MTERNKLVKVVSKLIELTQENVIKWENVGIPEPVAQGGDKRIGPVFEITYKEQRIRIYEEEYKDWYDEDKYTWSSRVVLAFVDYMDKNNWEFPQTVAGLRDLLESVKYQTANVDEFINKFIEEG